MASTSTLPHDTSVLGHRGEFTEAPGEIIPSGSEPVISGNPTTPPTILGTEPSTSSNAITSSPSPPLANGTEQRAIRDARTLPALSDRDAGYIPLSEENVFENGVWKRKPAVESGIRDKFDDRNIFVDNVIIIQIVTFNMRNAAIANWAKPITHWTIAELKPPWPTDNSTIEQISKRIKEKARGTWRWIHCEGYNGDALRAVAEATGWPVSQFACLFGWTRASAELAHGRLLIRLVDQGTDIFALYSRDDICPTFITCTGLEPNEDLKRRLYDFVERGDIGRPELVLRTDPSLMLYGLVRAIGQDLRASAYMARDTVVKAYDGATTLPSHDNLTFFHELQKRLYRIKVDTTGLVHALRTLKVILDKCHQPVEANHQPTNNAPLNGQSVQLVSLPTHERVIDQIGLVELLVDELQEICRLVDATSGLAFNTLAYNTNAFLKLLAVFTIIFLPISIITNIVATINAETSLNQRKHLSIVFGALGGVSILLLFFSWVFDRHYHKTIATQLAKRTTPPAGVGHREDSTPLPQSWSPDQLRKFDEGQKKKLRRQESLSRPDHPTSPRGSMVFSQESISNGLTGRNSTHPNPRHRKTHSNDPAGFNSTRQRKPPSQTLPPMRELDEISNARQGAADN